MRLTILMCVICIGWYSWICRSSVPVIVHLSTLEQSKVKISFLWKLYICVSCATWITTMKLMIPASRNMCGPTLDQIPNFRFCSVSSVKVAGYRYCHITSGIFVDYKQLVTLLGLIQSLQLLLYGCETVNSKRFVK